MFISNERSNLMVLGMLILTIQLSSCIAGQNLISIYGLRVTYGALIFQLTYILVAVSTELFGLEYTRSVIKTTVFCNLLMVSIILLFAMLPSSRSYLGDADLYHRFCMRLTYLMTVSAFAYYISEYTNSWVISKLKILTNGKYFVMRVWLSTTVGTIVDTWLVFPFYLSRQIDLSSSIIETFIHMFAKLGYDAFLVPISWIIIEIIKKRNSIEKRLLPEYAFEFTSGNYLKSIASNFEKS